MYDIAIIGAGVVGSLIARQLSRYEIKTCVIEKENDVAMGTTKANSAIIHAGYDCEIGSLKAQLNVRGNEMFDEIVDDLDVPFKRIGSLVVGFDDDAKTIEELEYRAKMNGVKTQIWTKEDILKHEPNLSDEIQTALFAPSCGIICPYELTIAAAENAVMNGVTLLLNTRVLSIKKDKWFKIKTNDSEIETKYIINAAGVYADKVANMIGDSSFDIKPRRGEYIIFDKKVGDKVNHVIFQPPTNMGKGVLVTPTVDGNLLIGPTSVDIEQKDDVGTTKDGLDFIVKGGTRTLPDFSMRDVINSFCGIRAKGTTGDFIIEESKVDSDFINVAGIESPGLSASPAIAEYVAEIVLAKGDNFKVNENFIAKRRPVIRFRDLSVEEKKQVINKNPDYGQIVCRCESVTQGEIIDSIRRPVGARDVDGVKRRTRSGMGRCQGGFCMPRVMEILSKELNVPIEDITKKGGDSKLIYKGL